MDTGGLFCIPQGRVPDTEMSEFLYPMLVLWRREEADSGGPGRQRGGVSTSIAFTPCGTEVPIGLVLASAGKAVSQNTGLAGGYPGNTAAAPPPGRAGPPARLAAVALGHHSPRRSSTPGPIMTPRVDAKPIGKTHRVGRCPPAFPGQHSRG